MHVFVETRLRWNDEEDIYNDDSGSGGKCKEKGKSKGKGEGNGNEQDTGLYTGERSKYRRDERLLPLFAPRDGYEYFPPHMIVYQRALASNN